MRNKFFLFGSYQGTRIAQGVTNLSTVPTANERDGIFSSPYSTRLRRAPIRRERARSATLFPGNQIPSSRFDPTGKKMVDVYPSPNLTGPNNYILNPGNNTGSNQYDSRFDLNISSRDTMFGRYSLTDAYGITPGPLPAPAVGQTTSGQSPTTAHGAALSETHTFSPHVINDFRMGFNRLSTQRLTQVTERLIEQYGFKGLPFFSVIGGLPAVSVTGYTGLGEGGTLPNIKLSQVTQFADGVSIVHGGHTFKGGVDVRFIISNAFTPSGTRGTLLFQRNLHAGSAAASRHRVRSRRPAAGRPRQRQRHHAHHRRPPPALLRLLFPGRLAGNQEPHAEPRHPLGYEFAVLGSLQPHEQFRYGAGS